MNPIDEPKKPMMKLMRYKYRESSGRGHDYQAKVFSRFNPAALIGEQQHTKGAEGQADGLDDDARVLCFEDCRNSAEHQAL